MYERVLSLSGVRICTPGGRGLNSCTYTSLVLCGCEKVTALHMRENQGPLRMRRQRPMYERLGLIYKGVLLSIIV